MSWLLHRGMERLSARERERVLQSLMSEPDLALAWGLKEALREVYRAQRPDEAAAALEKWITEAEECALQPFRRTASTLRRWQKEALNYWRHPLTNALVEGKHNWIKVLKRRAYGYRNDRSFLLRLLSRIHTD